MKLVVLMYVLLAFFMVRYANKLWAFKAMSRLQDIQMQIMLFGLWVVVMHLIRSSCRLGRGCFCFAAAAVYKFWIDIRLWRRAKSGLRYPCLLLQKGDGIVRGDDGDTCQQHSGYCGADAEPLSAGRRILLVPGCSVFVLVRPGGSRAFGKNGLGRKGKVSGQPKAEKSGAGLVC